VLGLMPPGPYNGNVIPKDLLEQWQKWKQKERIDEVPFPYGWGDGGGGPTLEMLEYGRRLGNIVGMPKCTHGRMQDCIDRIAEQAQYADLPVYNNELYLEYHRGCQTTQARTKRNNRKCEFLLRQAELLSSMSLAHGGPYDAGKLHNAWKIVLTNQFHDILPGSSIHEVYVQTEIDYAEAKKLAAEARAEALAHLAGKIDTSGEGEAILVFNTLSWVRDDVAHVSLPLPKGEFHVRDQAGKPVPHQVAGLSGLLFEAHDLPPLGYAVYRLVEGKAETETTGLSVTPRKLENSFLRVKLDKQGALTSVYDKIEGREIVPAGERANVLQLFEDRPHGNDAWDIEANFEDVMLELGPAQFEAVEQGPLRASLRFVRKTERSVITQEVTMYANAPRVDFVTHVDWREKRVLLKAAFPVDVRSSRAAYEVQFAAIERATHHNTDFDRARFEVPAHKWADLSEGDYGVSLLNDCKYGYDIKGNVMRLSLLRSPVDPDPTADECEHEFTYSLYPHTWSWRNGTVQQAFQLNERVLAMAAPSKKGPLETTGCFAAVDADNVVIDTVKKCEDSNALIVRLYEAYGQRGEVAVTFCRKPRGIGECDLMEENDTPLRLEGNTVRLYVKPFEIRTLKVKF
jgi:alpha-mannosidase